MNCKNVRMRLSAYQDKELSLPQSREVELHLESCAACQVEWQALKECIAGLGRLSTPVPAPDFSSRIMAGLLARPEKKYRLLPSLAYSLACLMIFLVGFLLEISSTSQPATLPQPTTTTFSSVLAESRDLGLLAVQDSTMEFLRSRVNGVDYEKQ